MIRRFPHLTLLTAILNLPVYADTVLDLTVDVDFWNMNSSGSFADSSDLQSFDLDLDLDTERTAVLSLAFKHPLLLVPNIKIRTHDLSSSGDERLTEDFGYSGGNFLSGIDVNVNFDAQSTDFIFYYEIFYNDTVSLDLGLNVKYLYGEIEVESSGVMAKESFDGYVPMLYGAVQFGMPTIRLSLFGDLNLLSVGDHTLQDYQAGIAFNLVESLAVNIKLKGGYRRLSLELNDLDVIYTDWNFDGAFLGLEADF
ncbi:MAG: TIGR04219 family outer membrane beta-barrel protein [Candidatus Thiodiazotropha sp. (ex Lucinoma aequizonata)]|nr:TIGR04219 family outer membrane beta-barrel protein [Candidatus Thiodiazotropha sp. (ex Lucinoma aequizonata)]MCU7897010.1 TIGR04219 family outer membrane beta-barrel protein [Candidatus Thiodiazotropha sp. (ex Lucinoma aequizonata)]MCU7898145.1 TIGR04219 family outer membrane beta-barrel protein [Candidatus Thiodiazotropha sp. (ex Lucinoma aequizonata)]MCU7903283.1 TIGR04219 family outer membrane beta-barrel protein [Candidatus Thiodiazotropha sp. (ex Lucinoma aequizonata)]MCU7909289.1 TIGR